MFNKIKDSLSRSGFGALMASAPAPLQPDSSCLADSAEEEAPYKAVTSKAVAALGAEHLSQVQWIAEAYAYKFTERAGNKGYTLNGNIDGKLCRFERGYPSRSYIRGIELRARAELDLPPDIALLLVNRTLKMNVQGDAQSRFADSVMASVDLEQPEEVLWMKMFSEVPIPNAPERFLSDYAVLAEEEQHAHLLCQPELMQLLLTWPRYSADRACVLMIARGKLYLRMRYSDDTFLLEHAMQTFTAAAKLALQNAEHFKR